MKRTFLIFSLSLFFLVSKAQNRPDTILIGEITKQLAFNINHSILKDSIAFYSFAIEVKLKREKNKIIVESMNVNDSIAYKLYKNLDFIKLNDYSSLLSKNKSAIVVIPVGLIIVGHNKMKGPAQINVYDLNNQIDKLFGFNNDTKFKEPKFTYLKPIIMYGDKTIYD